SVIAVPDGEMSRGGNDNVDYSNTCLSRPLTLNKVRQSPLCRTVELLCCNNRRGFRRNPPPLNLRIREVIRCRQLGPLPITGNVFPIVLEMPWAPHEVVEYVLLPEFVLPRRYRIDLPRGEPFPIRTSRHHHAFLWTSGPHV